MTTLPLHAPALARTATSWQTRFLLVHLWLPLAALLAISALLMLGGGDQWVADALYRLEGGHWLLKEQWFTSQLVHRGGKWLSTVAAVVVLGMAVLAWSRARPGARALRWPLTYLAASVALSTTLVSLLKSWTAMDCPWDLSRYGGTHPLIGLFASRHGLHASGCFPAGHASAGYAWVALYFCALALRPAWRWPALLTGLAAGAVFGVSQQLRGAHFLSHDLWSLGVCWLTALGLYWLLLAPPRQPLRMLVLSGGEQ
ncbi:MULTISPECIES: phosphatase PAP2 family protein [Xanthomonas]|uniref:phosphatase PAP2 family protein n=1 Tax=Xanthomonas TaxID=338 RepID=UPI00096C192E|nr:phosphatase PAP2 family protein [Xanthomonas campestris]MCC5093843.1 phosphatase PAP2 family protein [Xanthomonas campestris pv. incanae]MEA9613117.1 phosphatase PAP2 family protein [Xanthomonas campestris pv. incanae]MEA9619803.1 phosphatase PAP2 family protein [Xanthomonas campestris pv. incanae]RFF45998.1 phosphatase PAP2 family protein [Xanthomonas campestris pv. incanae]WDJ11072.1 phosphatase PAP2 family protein [Xanthomonas campestris pv. incanae]